MTTLKENFEKVRQRMKDAALRASRDPGSVRMVAVTKRKPRELIREAVDCGQLMFGENYIQESKEKITALGNDLIWHFIGQLQTNKAKPAAELFQVIETVDRMNLACALEKHLSFLNKTMDILIQINIGREPQKGGVLPQDAERLIREILEFSHLKVKGLMAMPPYSEDQEAVRPFFREMRRTGEDFLSKGLLGRHGPMELSMGMSGDFEAAIEEGATIVRIGTALFGERA